MFDLNFNKWLLVTIVPDFFNSAVQSRVNEAILKFPWIQRFASVGDSYSAGLRLGDRLDWLCS